MFRRALPTQIAPILAATQGATASAAWDARRFETTHAASVGRFRGRAIQREVSCIDWLDIALICLFLAGLYTHYTIQLSAKVPFPSAPAGVAGMILLWRRRDQIKPAAFAVFITVLLLYLLSISARPTSNTCPGEPMASSNSPTRSPSATRCS